MALVGMRQLLLYNAETKEYVYEETETAKLADEFKINR